MIGKPPVVSGKEGRPMKYRDPGGEIADQIRILRSISYVSARLARNLELLTAERQSMERRKKSGRNNQRAAQHSSYTRQDY